MPFMAWMTAPDGAAQFVNQRWCKFTGLSYEESLGLGWRQVLDPNESSEALLRWMHKVREGVPHIDSLHYRRADGEFQSLVSKTWPIKDPDGVVIAWLGVAMDPADPRSDPQEASFIAQVAKVLATSDTESRLITA